MHGRLNILQLAARFARNLAAYWLLLFAEKNKREISCASPVTVYCHRAATLSPAPGLRLALEFERYECQFLSLHHRAV